MRFLLLTKEENCNKYKKIIDFLGSKNIIVTLCYNINNPPNNNFDFYLIEDFLWNEIEIILNIPFFINLNKDKEIEGVFSNKNFVGYLDLTSNPTFIYSVFKNSTALVVANNRKISEKNKILSMAIDNSPISIMITDSDGIIESVNPRVCEVTGYDYDSLIGQNPRILKSENSVTDYKDMWLTLTSGRVWKGEFCNKKKSGEEYRESVIITPVFDENSDIIKYVGLKEDLTGLLTIQKELEETLVSLEETVNKRTLVLRNTQSLLLESLATLSEYRDNETGAHIKRTKLYVKFLVECIRDSLDYTEYELVQLWSSAPLHDIGKVAVPDNILLKPDKLTDEEFDIMKMHPIHGNEALMRVSECKDDDNFLKFAKEITLFHHEKWDGSGYPYGLEGEDIPISARMMALADVYDALRSKRPYKDPIPHDKVMDMILEERGRHFDPVLVDLFIEFNGKFNDIFTNSMVEVFNFDDL